MGSGGLTLVPEGPVAVITTEYPLPGPSGEKVTWPVVAASPVTVGCGTREAPAESLTSYVYDVTALDTGKVSVTEVSVAEGRMLEEDRAGGDGIVTARRAVCSVGVVSNLPKASWLYKP